MQTHTFLTASAQVLEAYGLMILNDWVQESSFRSLVNLYCKLRIR
jgi:hypothetical protein